MSNSETRKQGIPAWLIGLIAVHVARKRIEERL